MAACTTLHGPPELRLDRLPPTEPGIVETLRSADLPVSVHPLCEELAGGRAATIGEYVAQLLALDAPAGGNDISVWSDEGGEDGYWEAEVLVSTGVDPERSHWGLEFLIRKSDGLVPPESFRCTVPWW